jgi:hypothetical protein
MKKLILCLATLLPFSAIADGIPVPMDQQTPHNWMCDNDKDQRISLHLIAEGGYNVLYVSYWGGTVGTNVGEDVANKLIHSSNMDGISVNDTEFKRQLAFKQSSNGAISVLLTDYKYDISFEAINCVKYSR